MIRRLMDATRWTVMYRLALMAFRPWELRRWKRRNRSAPTPHLRKRQVLTEYAKLHGTETLVETGTYMGEMVAAVRGLFRTIYSIEVSERVYRAAAKRFAHHGHVHILHGDSSDVLPQILSSLRSPTLFWLDAHYSAGVTEGDEATNPIRGELDQILSREAGDDVILIDDADLFVGRDGYPALSEIRRLVADRPGWTVEVVDNVIAIHGPPSLRMQI